MSQMKYPDAIRNIFDHGKIMCDKQIRGSCLLLDILHQVNDLCLNGNVQRRDTLICNDQFRVHDQRSRNSDTLSLSTGKLMRITARMLRRKSNLCQNIFDLFLTLRACLVHVMDI